ncbi:MAG: hypothetical protein FWC91_03445 [Defluviitaleaceae bacterium]|nr:hypothetical protein [Defluviitaleaceae bacterium]
MKKCKVYNHANKIEAEGIIIDKKVLFAAPHQENIKPTCIIDGQCYYPLAHTKALPLANMSCVPFSTVCEWDEFMDFSDETTLPYPGWVCVYVNIISDLNYYTLKELNIAEEKWGHCDGWSGEITMPPQWDWCDEFCDDGFAIVKAIGYYGVVDENFDFWIYPDYYSICNVDIKRAETANGIFFVKNLVKQKWGAFDLRYDPPNQKSPDIGYKWDDIWWDGWGGYTTMENTKNGHKLYGIVNRGNEIIAQNLTKKPVRYNVPTWETRQNSYRDGGQYVSFRILANGEKYGLVVDIHDDVDGSKLLLEPSHTYESVLEAAAKEDMEWEIAHYAYLIWKTPAHITTAWDNVPQDIVEDVRKYMYAHDWKQGAWD